MVVLSHKRNSATIRGTMVLSFLLVITALVGYYEESAVAQITPTAFPANGDNHQDTDESANPISDNDATAVEPITPSGSTTSNSNGSARTLDQKYVSTPHPTGASYEETLVEKIFNKVNDDFKASGITGIYP